MAAVPPPTPRIEEFEVLLETGSVTIGDLYHVVSGMNSSDEDTRKIYAKYYPNLLSAFENKWGTSYFYAISVEHSTALILTEKSYLFHLESTTDLATLAFLHQCDTLKIEAYRHLTSDELFSCMSMICELISHLFNSIKKVAERDSTEENHYKMIEYLYTQLEKVNEYFIKGAQRVALHAYYMGMIKGILLIGAISIIFGVSLLLLTDQVTMVISIFGSLLVGGLGAIISVMTRMSSGNFSLDYNAGIQQNKRLGEFRPIIGSAMGVILFFLMMSGLLPFDVPQDATTQIYYVLSIAFSAGFTERWAQGFLPGINEEGKTNTKNGNQSDSENDN